MDIGIMKRKEERKKNTSIRSTGVNMKMIYLQKNAGLSCVITHLFTCQEDLHDTWVNEIKAGEWLLRGAWSQKRQRNSRSHVLLDEQPPAFCDLHLVLCTKFMMTITSHKCKGLISTYTLSPEIEKMIMQAICDRELLEFGQR
jgi:hypothetical protein